MPKERIPNGAEVMLTSEFQTQSGKTYTEGSRGVKVGDWDHGWEVKMDDDGVTLVIPAHTHPLTVLDGE